LIIVLTKAIIGQRPQFNKYYFFMNKTILSLIFSALAPLSIYSQNNSYTLNGKIAEKHNGEKIYLQQLNNDRNNLISIDSTTINNGQFSFKESFNQSNTGIRFITTQTPATSGPIIFVPETGNIHISLIDSILVSGTPLNEEFQGFMDKQGIYKRRIENIINNYKALSQTDENLEKRNGEIEAIIEELSDDRFAYAQKNIKNDLGEFITLTSFEILPPDRILELVYQTRPEFKDSPLGKNVIAYYESQKSKSPGANYQDIELNDPTGKKVKLSDYVGKGKIVLVDFWASWCGPCIKEMPHIVELYNKYKDKNFEIVGISMDDNQQSWIKSIERFNITWPQMSDLKGWKSSAAALYGVDSIPFTLLLDGEGKVISSNLRGKDLTAKLSELLD
jgi:peroxiredoxin